LFDVLRKIIELGIMRIAQFRICILAQRGPAGGLLRCVCQVL
jgi:hypothetical protein